MTLHSLRSFLNLLRPVINLIASIYDRMLCGRSETSDEARGYTLGGGTLPGSDPIEASRRRGRGARALEERLAAERLTSARSTEELQRDTTDNVQSPRTQNYTNRKKMRLCFQIRRSSLSFDDGSWRQIC